MFFLKIRLIQCTPFDEDDFFRLKKFEHMKWVRCEIGGELKITQLIGRHETFAIFFVLFKWLFMLFGKTHKQIQQLQVQACLFQFVAQFFGPIDWWRWFWTKDIVGFGNDATYDAQIAIDKSHLFISQLEISEKKLKKLQQTK